MPSLKDRDLNALPDSAAGALPENAANRQQPIALEVPVTVNGARPLEGSEKREPFSESTKTVLVLGNGAVLRLGSAVAPGQLLFLTNEKTKKEVVCQVVKSKNYSNTNGYVEVEFTEPVVGFWGLRFPADHAALRSSSLPAAKMHSVKPDFNAGSDADRFKTDLTVNERASHRADLLAPAETSTEALKLEANRLQEQLSALMFAEQQTAQAEKPVPSAQAPGRNALSETTAKLFEIADIRSGTKTTAGAVEADPGAPATPKRALSDSAKSTLQAEELKIPAWLEPLARNAATPAPPEESASKNDPAPLEEAHKPEAEKKPSKTASGKAKTFTAAPVFGDTLLGQSAAERAAPRGSNKGALIITIAAGIFIVAAATWYLRRPSSPPPSSEAVAVNPAPTAAAPRATTESSATPSSQQTQIESAQPLAAETPQPKPASSVVPENSSSASSPAQLKSQPAVISERVPKPRATTEATAAASHDSSAEPVELEPKRASLGKVRLAKPKIHRNGQAGGIAEPSLTETDGQAVPADASLGAGLVAENASQPLAPAAPGLAVGGNVKPARLLSSVPPAYPPIAKNQHVAGDVRIDALIDATGHVSSMKVVAGPTLLHQAAMEALRQWKYQPATLNGNPVSMHLTVTIQFRLQ